MKVTVDDDWVEIAIGSKTYAIGKFLDGSDNNIYVNDASVKGADVRLWRSSDGHYDALKQKLDRVIKERDEAFERNADLQCKIEDLQIKLEASRSATEALAEQSNKSNKERDAANSALMKIDESERDLVLERDSLKEQLRKLIDACHLAAQRADVQPELLAIRIPDLLADTIQGLRARPTRTWATLDGSSRDLTLRELQTQLPWTIRYHHDFRASPMAHKDFGHALLHILKAAGKLAEVVNQAEHGGNEFKSADVDPYVADMVVCALRLANTVPGRTLDLQQAVEKRIEMKNNVTLQRPREPGEGA